MYKLKQDGVILIENEMLIPSDEKNRDWRKYQEWLAQGNTPEPEFSPEEIQQQEQSNMMKQRTQAFGSIGDQLDMLYHDLKAIHPTASWIKHIKKVKTDNPL